METSTDDRLIAEHSDELHSYRSVSVAALFTLILGLASVAALAHPAAWLIPSIGILLGIFAIYRTRKHSDRLAGYSIALVGIALAIFFGAFAPTKHFYSRQFLAKQGHAYAQEWIQWVLEDDLQKAHQAYLDPHYRQPDGTPLREFYENNPKDQQELEEFFHHGVLNDLNRCTTAAQVEYDGCRRVFIAPDVSTSVHVFTLSEAEIDPVQVRMEVTRTERTGNVYWGITGIIDQKSAHIE